MSNIKNTDRMGSGGLSTEIGYQSELLDVLNNSLDELELMLTFVTKPTELETTTDGDGDDTADDPNRSAYAEKLNCINNSIHNTIKRVETLKNRIDV